MIKQEKDALLYWNYFTALESDVVRLARYVELVDHNYEAYSIEMVRLYLTACSEIDVVAEQLCKVIDPESDADKIHKYREKLRGPFPEIENSEIRIPRYGLVLHPWSRWKEDKTPGWWEDHQLVKHKRGDNYKLGNLHNVLNSVAALFILTVIFLIFPRFSGHRVY